MDLSVYFVIFTSIHADMQTHIHATHIHRVATPHQKTQISSNVLFFKPNLLKTPQAYFCFPDKYVVN